MKRSVSARLLAGLMSLILFIADAALAHVPESNFWAERRRRAREGASEPLLLASLPTQNSSQILSDLPSVRSTPLQQLTPALAEQIQHEAPSSSVAAISSMIRTLPQTYGRIRRLSFPKGHSLGKTVIHIQDVHLNLEAQQNIGDAIQALINGDKVQLIALEGSFHPIHLDKLRSYPRKETVRVVVNDMLAKNEISGPIHAALTSGKSLPPFEGVDQPDEYRRNVDAYKRSVSLTSGNKVRLANLHQDLAHRKTKTFNRDLAAFDIQVDTYRRGILPLGDYLQMLASKIPNADSNVQNFIAALNAEKKLDFGQVEKERSSLIEEIAAKANKDEMRSLLEDSVAYRAGHLGYGSFYRRLQETCFRSGLDLSRFPAMRDYIAYVLLSDQVNAEKLFRELVRLELLAYDHLAKTPQEKQLVAQSRRIHFTGKLLDFSLTPDEWKEYQALQASPIPIDLSVYEAFYREAEARNISMTRNLLAAMERAEARTAVLVTGGFHSDGIEEALRQNGVACLTFVPKITKVDDTPGGAYLSAFTLEKTPLEKIFEGNKLFVAKNGCPESTPMTFSLRAVAYDLLHKFLDAEQVPTVLREYAGETADKIRVVHARVSSNRAEIAGMAHKEVCERAADATVRFSERPLSFAERVNPWKLLKESRFLGLPLFAQAAASATLLMVWHEPEFLPAVPAISTLFSGVILFLDREAFLHIHTRADYRRVASDILLKQGRGLTEREYAAKVLRGYFFFGGAALVSFGLVFNFILSYFSTTSPAVLLVASFLAAVAALAAGGFVAHPAYNVISSVPAMAGIPLDSAVGLLMPAEEVKTTLTSGQDPSGDWIHPEWAQLSEKQRVAARLGWLRERMGLGSQREVAERLGIPKGTYAKYENFSSFRAPPLDVLSRFVDLVKEARRKAGHPLEELGAGWIDPSASFNALTFGAEELAKLLREGKDPSGMPIVEGWEELTEKQRVAMRLTWLRERMELGSQREVAERLGLVRRTYASYEALSKSNTPPSKTLSAFVDLVKEARRKAGHPLEELEATWIDPMWTPRSDFNALGSGAEELAKVLREGKDPSGTPIAPGWEGLTERQKVAARLTWLRERMELGSQKDVAARLGVLSGTYSSYEPLFKPYTPPSKTLSGFVDLVKEARRKAGHPLEELQATWIDPMWTPRSDFNALTSGAEELAKVLREGKDPSGTPIAPGWEGLTERQKVAARLAWLRERMELGPQKDVAERLKLVMATYANYESPSKPYAPPSKTLSGFVDLVKEARRKAGHPLEELQATWIDPMWIPRSNFNVLASGAEELAKVLREGKDPSGTPIVAEWEGLTGRQKVAARLAWLREQMELGLQKDVAERLGVLSGTYGGYENLSKHIAPPSKTLSRFVDLVKEARRKAGHPLEELEATWIDPMWIPHSDFNALTSAPEELAKVLREGKDPSGTPIVAGWEGLTERQKVAARLAWLRERTGLGSRREVAKRLGLFQGTYSNYEYLSNPKAPPPSVLSEFMELVKEARRKAEHPLEELTATWIDPLESLPQRNEFKSAYSKAEAFFSRYHLLDLAVSLSNHPEELQQALAILLTAQGAKVKESELQEMSRAFVLNLREAQSGHGNVDFRPSDPLEYVRALMALQEQVEKLNEHEQFVLMRAFVRMSFAQFAADFDGVMKQMKDALSESPMTPFLESLVDHVEKTLGEGLKYQPLHIRTPLLPHQRVGAWYMRHSDDHQDEGIFGFLLEDDTRMGKTIQTYAAMDPSWKCAIVVPASVMDTWEEQFYQHTNGKMRFIPVSGTPEEKRQIIAATKDQKGVVLVFSIEDLRGRGQDEFEAISQGLDLAVVDEGQRIENYGGLALKTSSLQAKAVHRLKTFRRWILSATPYTRDYRQLFSVFNLIHTNPQTGHVTNPLFESRRAFNKVFDGSLGSMKWLYALKARISLRRKKSEQGRLYTRAREVNPGEEGYFTVTREQAELELRIIKNLGEYLKLYNQRVPDEERIPARSISIFLKLQFLTWAMTDPEQLGENIPTTYWDAMDKVILGKPGEPIRLSAGKPGIIFAENTTIINKTVGRYRAKGYRVARIDGTVSGMAIDERGRLIRVRFEGRRMVEDPAGHPISAQAYQRHLFQSGQVDLVVMNRRAGVGLDMSRAEWELFAQLPDTYVNYHQSRDRGLGLNPDPTGAKLKEVEVLFLLPRYPKSFVEEKVGTDDAAYVQHGTPAEIHFRMMMGQDREQFNLVMEGIPPESELTEQEALGRLVHSIRGFLEDPSMARAGGRQKREMQASSALFPLYQKAKGNKVWEDEVLTLVGNFSRTEVSPAAFARAAALSSDFNLNDLSFINALFDVPNKLQRDQLLGLLPDLFGWLFTNHLSVSGLTERGPPALQAMAQTQPELVIPFLAATQGWSVRETDEQVLEAVDPGAIALLQVLEELYADGLSDYDRQQWVKRYVYGLIGLIDLGRADLLGFMSRIQEDFLDETLSLEDRISFLERLGVLRQSAPAAYNHVIRSAAAFSQIQEELGAALTETFIVLFDLPRTSETLSRLTALARQWGNLSAPLLLMSKLMNGDARDYQEHIALFKKTMQHVVAGDYYEWRNGQSLDRTGHEITYKQDDPTFWRTFTREETVSLGKVTVSPRDLVKAQKRRMRDVSRLLDSQDALDEAFGPLARTIAKDLATPGTVERLQQEVKIVGTQRGALPESQTAAVEELNRQLKALRTRLNLLLLRDALQADKPEQPQEIVRPLKSLMRGLAESVTPEGGQLIPLALKELETAMEHGAVTRTFEDVEVRITADPDLIMRRGMLEQDLVNCFNLKAGRAQVAALVDDLASRNKMLAVVKAGGRTAGVAVIKVRQTPDGRPILHIERPLFRFAYNFEREIAKALEMSKLPELPGVSVTGDWYKGEEKARMVQLETTGARGPTEYHETVFGYRRRSSKVSHAAGILIEAGTPEEMVDDAKEGVTRIRIQLEGRDHDVIGVGHSNRTQQDFLELVRRLGIRRLVDVRSRPMSRYYPHFNQRAMQAYLAEAGVEYVWMGEKLGGKLPEYNGDFEAYMQDDPDGRFGQGIEELRQSISETRGPVAVICSEKNPHDCHRRFILTHLAGGTPPEQGGQLGLFTKPTGRMSLVDGAALERLLGWPGIGEFFEKFVAFFIERPILSAIIAGPPLWAATVLTSGGAGSSTQLVAGAAAFLTLAGAWGHIVSHLFSKAHPAWRNLGREPIRLHWRAWAAAAIAMTIAIPLSPAFALWVGALGYTLAGTVLHLVHDTTHEAGDKPAPALPETIPSHAILATDYAAAMSDLAEEGKISPTLLNRILPGDLQSVGLAQANNRGISLMGRALSERLPQEPDFQRAFYESLRFTPSSASQVFSLMSGSNLRKAQVLVRLVDEQDVEAALRMADLVKQIGEPGLNLILTAKTPAVLERLKSVESDFVYVSTDRLAKAEWREDNTDFHLMRPDDIDPQTALQMIKALPLGPDLLRLLERLLPLPEASEDIEIRLRAAEAVAKFA